MLAVAFERLAARFGSGSDQDRGRWHGVALAIALYLGVYGLYSQWYIEDAAIVFAYARNAANGLGYVPWPGGERVEGFSDPTWTVLLTLLQFVGISPWIAAKLLGAGLGAATLPLVARWARAIVPAEADPHVPVLAAAFLAISPQFAAWNASGLENALLAWLVARGAVDLVEGAPPARTGLWWGLVAVTRPEGAMYAGIAGLVGTAAAATGGPVTALRWAVPCALAGVLPFTGWHLARYPYFAWTLPNTAYAKLWETAEFQPAVWTSYGWSYLQNWALRTAQGFVFPLYLLGLTGVIGWRRWVGVGATAALGLALLPGLSWPREIPYWPLVDSPPLSQLRLATIAAVLLVLPWVGVGRHGSAGRILAWTLATAGLFFTVYSGGDWMLGFRWLALPAIPLAVLLADAIYTVGTWATGPGPRAALWVGVLGPVLGTGAWEIARYVRSADTSPFDVQDRVEYHIDLAARIGLDTPPRLADVDMGAHMWWSGGPILDYAGLIDVPFGHAHWQIPFEEEYLYGELRPDFLHVHGSWNAKSKLRSAPSFRADYVAVPGYPTAGKPHEGSFVRRELLMGAPWDGPTDRKATFSQGKIAIQLEGFELVGSTFAAGGALPLRTAWSRVGSVPPVRIWAFLATGDRVVQAWELQPAHDWLPPDRWKAGDRVVSRNVLVLPDIAPGTYDIGFAVVGQRLGTPWPGSGGDPVRPRLILGEVAWSNTVSIGSRAGADAETDRYRLAANHEAVADRCEPAIAAYRRAKDRLIPADPRRPDLLAPRAAIGRCLARTGDPTQMRDAMRWAPEDPAVRELGVRLADQWAHEGEIALEAGNSDEAHRLWSDALAADPLRPWLRRRVEELRVRRLELRHDGEAAPPPDEADREG